MSGYLLRMGKCRRCVLGDWIMGWEKRSLGPDLGVRYRGLGVQAPGIYEGQTAQPETPHLSGTGTKVHSVGCYSRRCGSVLRKRATECPYPNALTDYPHPNGIPVPERYKLPVPELLRGTRTRTLWSTRSRAGSSSSPLYYSRA